MKRLKELRKKRNLTLKQLGELLNISDSSLSLYENGKRQPDYDTLKQIANYFDVSIDYLLGNETVIVKHTPGVKIPLLGEVRAGLPIYAPGNVIDYEEITHEMASRGEHFALKVKGDSMAPDFQEGDIIVVRKQSVVENGDIAIVMGNGDEATIKRFYKDDEGITLKPNNPAYPALVYSAQQVNDLPVTVCGKVVELRRSL